MIHQMTMMTQTMMTIINGMFFKYKLVWLAVLTTITFFGCSESEPSIQPDYTASAKLFQVLSDTDSTYIVTSKPRGEIYVEQVDSVVNMTINLSGFIPNSVHAIHMHHGSCEQPKHHWNAGSTETFCNTKSLGFPWSKPYAGDIGNLSIAYDSTGSMTIQTDLWRLGSGDERDILGLQVIIHENLEDFTSECDPNHGGHAHFNAKIACGKIL